jgi:uncharacterized protein (TIGR03546 family)
MLAILKLLQSLVSTLHSEGTPGQIAAGITLGAALGLTPLVNVHNAVIFALVLVLNVSFGAAMLGWALCVPLGFLLDPLFHRVGHALLLDTPALTPFWTRLYNLPVLPYANFNNTVVLGSFVSWLVLTPLIYFLSRLAVLQYRARFAERIERSAFMRAMKASKAYNVYRWFQP